MASFGGSAAPQVKNLEEFERKSAAIETIFTLAVLYVGVLQIVTPQRVYRYLALVPVVFLLALALLLGGENLWKQIQSRISSVSRS
jgi:hypothetical protein